jgi:hypothetical protein
MKRTALLSAQGCWAVRLLVSAGQTAQDAQPCRQPRYGIEAFITCGRDPVLPCRPKLVSDPPQPNMIGTDRFALVKAQIKLIPADRDL